LGQTDGNRQSEALEQREVHVNVQQLGLEHGEPIGGGEERL
jgi:hypothetical protein